MNMKFKKKIIIRTLQKNKLFPKLVEINVVIHTRACLPRGSLSSCLQLFRNKLFIYPFVNYAS